MNRSDIVGTAQAAFRSVALMRREGSSVRKAALRGICNMTLNEMSAQYREAAVPIRLQLKELRRKLKHTTDREDAWHIKRRIEELSPILTQLNDLAWLLEHYYEVGGGEKDERYAFNGKKKRCAVRKAEEGVDSNLKKRINRLSKTDFCGLSLQEKERLQNCRGAGSEQKHRVQDARKSGTESQKIPEVFPVSGLSEFFEMAPPKRGKKGRRKKCESE